MTNGERTGMDIRITSLSVVQPRQAIRTAIVEVPHEFCRIRELGRYNAQLSRFEQSSIGTRLTSGIVGANGNVQSVPPLNTFGMSRWDYHESCILTEVEKKGFATMIRQSRSLPLIKGSISHGCCESTKDVDVRVTSTSC